MLNAEAIAAITIPVVTLTELIKFFGAPKTWGMGLVLVLSALGVGAWAFSQPPGAITHESTFGLFSGYSMVVAAAAGVYGFIRQASATAVTSTRKEDGFLRPGIAILLALGLSAATMGAACAGRQISLEPGSSRAISARGIQVVQALDGVRITLKEIHGAGGIGTDVYTAALDRLEEAGLQAQRLAQVLTTFEIAQTVAERASAREQAAAILAGLEVVLPTIAPQLSQTVDKVSAILDEIRKLREQLSGPVAAATPDHPPRATTRPAMFMFSAPLFLEV